jgi:hypothetical protein
VKRIPLGRVEGAARFINEAAAHLVPASRLQITQSPVFIPPLQIAPPFAEWV